MITITNPYNPSILKEGYGSNTSACLTHYTHGSDRMGNLVTLWYPGGPDSSIVEHLVQFQKGLGSSPGLVTFHAAIGLPDSSPIMLLLANIGKDSSPMNPLHAHVARLHLKQETTFSMIVNTTNNHGTPNETPSKTSSYSWIITQAYSAFKKASYSSSSTILLYIAMHLILSFPILFSNSFFLLPLS